MHWCVKNMGMCYAMSIRFMRKYERYFGDNNNMVKFGYVKGRELARLPSLQHFIIFIFPVSSSLNQPFEDHNSLLALFVLWTVRARPSSLPASGS